MANSTLNYQKYLNQWEPQFKKRTANFTSGPVAKRKCQDICCVVTFILLFAMFVSISAYSIDKAIKQVDSDINPNPNPNPNPDPYSNSNPTLGIDGNDLFGDSTQLKNFIFAVVGMSLLSLVMCVIFVLLTKSYPKCMVYGVVILVSLIFVAAALVMFFIGVALIAILLIVVMALYLFLMFYCFKKHLKTAIVMVKVSGTFLTERPMVYVIPAIMGLITLIFTVLWASSITGLVILLLANPPPLSYSTTESIITIQGFAYTFFTFFSYYVMVFLVASCVAVWYYQSERSMLGSGIRWLMKGHIGSITFAALMITIIKMVKTMVKKKAGRGNACGEACRCICICFLTVLEQFVKVMNRFAVIIMSFTGEDFITSCKSTGIIIYKNVGVFAIITIVSNFFYYSGLLLCIGVPTTIAGIIASNIQMKQVALPIVLVLCSSFLISSVFLTTFTETLTSVFVFYSLDMQLNEYGIRVVNVPSDMQLLLEHAFDDSEDYRESFLEKAKGRQAENGVFHTDEYTQNEFRAQTQPTYTPPLMNTVYTPPVSTYAAPVYSAYPPPPPQPVYAHPPQAYPSQQYYYPPQQPVASYYPPPQNR